jgi:hypothetical protein
MVCYIEDELLDSERANAILKIPAVGYDFVTSLCGEYLGSGQFRSVFDYALDDKYVIKVEPKNTNCNTIEYMMYNEIQYLQGDLNWVKDWFSPVKWISPNGRLLVMRKTKPHTDKTKKKRPDNIPKFLWDVKEENFGWIGNNYVCHDYGQLYNLIEYSKRMVKIDWDK